MLRRVTMLVTQLMNKPVIVIGSGGHAVVVMDILGQLGIEIEAIYSVEPKTEAKIFKGITFIFDDQDDPPFKSGDVSLVNAIGSLPGNDARSKVHEKFKLLGFDFLSVIAPTAIVSDYATLSEGVHILSRAVVNAGAVIGESTIVNTGVIVEHDCNIGKHNHLAPGCTISGGVSTGNYVHVGVGANIIQGLDIGSNVLIGAGATATEHIGWGEKLYVAKTFVRKQGRF